MKGQNSKKNFLSMHHYAMDIKMFTNNPWKFGRTNGLGWSAVLTTRRHKRTAKQLFCSK